jgi:transcriptional regulator with XRE-family HTH domain
LNEDFMPSYRANPSAVACYLLGIVNVDEIKQLRAELKCTARELAQTLGLEPGEVQAWEAGERFPTKRLVAQMETLRAKGPTSIQRKTAKRPSSSATPLSRLADPEFWAIVRKLASHQDLFVEVAELAKRFDDPTA